MAKILKTFNVNTSTEQFYLLFHKGFQNRVILMEVEVVIFSRENFVQKLPNNLIYSYTYSKINSIV